jgi:(1->4)-alpha-D-glucan 1-alpha-D-glucosylmutase
VKVDEQTALDRLAQAAGIDDSYVDYWGTTRVASAETKTHMLRALGYPVDDERSCERALARIVEAPWLRPLEPVAVVVQGAPLCVTVTLPAAEAMARLHWVVREESGATHEGSFVPAELALAQTRVVDGTAYERRTLELAVRPEPGYHRLIVGKNELRLIVAPPRCYLPAALEEGARLWGFVVQLYALRSRVNWGIGDFGDLRRLVELTRDLGGSAVGLNPLHQLHLHNPEAASPYGPSSRLFLNTIYLDVAAIAEFADCAEAQRLANTELRGTLEALRGTPLVDYGGVARAKRSVLELLYRSFREHRCERAGGERAADFRRFQAEGGPALERLSIYEALTEHFFARDPAAYGWQQWPAEYRDPHGAAVAAFAAQRRERVEFFAYLQWNADRQLAAAASAAALPVGLYRDLAVGVDANGVDAWSQQDVVVVGARVGAPPDPLNTLGQDWGLPPMHPERLRETGYEAFAELLRANMRHAGALRIDHVMALKRLYWIPRELTASEGAYLRYPFEDLLGVIALESHRNRCMVVGEDLGTVPAGFRERLQDARILSCRLLFFERDKAGRFLPPAAYPPLALVTTATHDLHTLPGFWNGCDLGIRSQLGMFATEDAWKADLAGRELGRDYLLEALVAQGDLAPAVATSLRNAAGQPLPPSDMTALVDAAYRYLAASPSALMMVALEDVLGELNQVNLPGTVDQHPNWRRKLTLDLEDLAHDPRLRSVTREIRARRPAR